MCVSAWMCFAQRIWMEQKRTECVVYERARERERWTATSCFLFVVFFFFCFSSVLVNKLSIPLVCVCVCAYALANDVCGASHIIAPQIMRFWQNVLQVAIVDLQLELHATNKRRLYDKHAYTPACMNACCESLTSIVKTRKYRVCATKMLLKWNYMYSLLKTLY